MTDKECHPGKLDWGLGVLCFNISRVDQFCFKSLRPLNLITDGAKLFAIVYQLLLTAFVTRPAIVLDRWSAPASLPQPSHFFRKGSQSMVAEQLKLHSSWFRELDLSPSLSLNLLSLLSFLTEHSWWSNCDSRSFLAGTPPWNPPATSTQPAMGGSCSPLRRLQQPFSTLLLSHSTSHTILLWPKVEPKLEAYEALPARLGTVLPPHLQQEAIYR